MNSKILFVLVLSVLFTCFVPGCKVLGNLWNVIISSEDADLGGTDVEGDVPDPANQLWNTVKKSNWFIALSIPIIAFGAVAMFNGMKKLGISAVIFGSVNLFMALATARFAFIMAVCGLIGSVAAVVASILVKNRALKDIICNVQDIKNLAKNDNVDIVFQDKIKETLARQVKSTKKIVNDIKSKVYS